MLYVRGLFTPARIFGFVGLVSTIGLIIGAAVLPSPARDVMAGVAASFIFAISTGVIRAADDAIRKRRLTQLFGRELVRRCVYLSYPDFVPHNEVVALLADRNRQFIYQKPFTSEFKASREHRIDLERAVAANDIQALLYVSGLFESTYDRPTIIKNDAYMVKNCSRSFISFGLSSNDCTHLYLKHAAEKALFKIVPDGLGSEYLELLSGDQYRRSAEEEYGIIVRYSPDPEEEPGLRWLLVAGLGPSGTTGSAWYLFRHWKRLLREVGSRDDFCAVICTSPESDKISKLLKIEKFKS